MRRFLPHGFDYGHGKDSKANQNKISHLSCDGQLLNPQFVSLVQTTYCISLAMYCFLFVQIFNLERKLELHVESEDSFEAGSIMNRKRG